LEVETGFVPADVQSVNDAEDEAGRIALHPLLPALSLSVVAGGLMAARTWVMSGCLVYPASFTCRGGPSAIGAERAAAESSVILSWARSGTADHLAIPDLSWIPAWYSELEWDIGFRIAIFAIIVGIAVRLLDRRGAEDGDRRLPGLLWLYAALGIMFWFVAAPDARFGFPLLLTLGALVLAPAFTVRASDVDPGRRPSNRAGPLVSAVALAAVATASILAGGRYFPYTGAVPHGFESDMLPDPTDAAGGWHYVYPLGSDQCGDAFPCAPGPRDLTVERSGSRLVFRTPNLWVR
jgi:hypothetical protein